ncbi:MAG: lamin tail domain-containing protein [Chloroflexota bacterium]|nr:lamin tail domain-containing protein [Chloroflexota bacterium]
MRKLRSMLVPLALMALLLALPAAMPAGAQRFGKAPESSGDGLRGASADHVVISEVQADSIDGSGGTDDDWIELYNPTGADIDLADGSYRIEKTVTAVNPDIVMRIGDGGDGTYPGGTTIPAHGFYLIVCDKANETLKDKADAIGTRSEFTWTSHGYTFYLGDGAISGDNDSDIVDKVGFGSDASYYEGAGPAPEIPDGGSIERKAQSTSTSESMAPGGSDASRGNGYDSDNNSQDFVLRDSPEPQNSSSPTETLSYELFMPLIIRNLTTW